MTESFYIPRYRLTYMVPFMQGFANYIYDVQMAELTSWSHR